MSRALRSLSDMFFLGFFCLNTAVAEIKMPGIFDDNMVLQRNMPVPVWGKARPGEKIVVTIGDASQSGYADKLGNWKIKLPTMKAGGPFRMSITGENVVQFEGVMIGDVWFCGGQSNMQWQLRQTGYKEEEKSLIESAPIRLFTVEIATDYKPREDNLESISFDCSYITIT